MPILSFSNTSTLNSGLYAAYNAESNANDSLGLYNGTSVGGLSYVTGLIGNSFQFNGTNSMVQLINNLLNFSGDFAIGIWVNMSVNTSGFKTLVSNNKLLLSPTRQYGFGCYLNNTEIRFQKYNGTGTPLTLAYDLTTLLSVNTWHLVVLEYSTVTGRKIYFDDALVASDSDVTSIVYDTTHYPTIGAQRYDGVNSEYFMNGKIDMCYFWNNRILTSSERTKLYNSRLGKLLP